MYFNLDKYDYSDKSYEAFYKKALNKQLTDQDLKSMQTAITNIKKGVFCFNDLLTLKDIQFLICSVVEDNAFYRCVNIQKAIFPTCNYIGKEAFYSCHSLNDISFPSCTYIGKNAFNHCHSLNIASFPSCSLIEEGAFLNCNLSSIYLMSNSMCVLSASSVFWQYANNLKVYVPNSLLSQYKNASNWSYLSNKIYGI